MVEGGPLNPNLATTEVFHADAERKNISRIGLSLAIYLLIVLVAQILLGSIFGDLITDNFSALVDSGWFFWLLVYLPQFIICVPIAYLMLRTNEPQEPVAGKLGTGNYLLLMIMCVAVLYIGNIIGSFLTGLFGAGNALQTLAVNSNLWATLIFAVILVPITEELIFRKLVMDRLLKYGDKIAILLSALLFALMHVNLAQLFYAFGLGILFGYVYARTGKLRYSIGLHAFVNFLGMFIGTIILRTMEKVDLEAVANLEAAGGDAVLEQAGQLFIVGIYGIVMIALTIAGLVLIITRWKKVQLKEAVVVIPKGRQAKIVFGNPGIILYLVLSVIGILAPLFLAAA